jgi:hypothetical protein
MNHARIVSDAITPTDANSEMLYDRPADLNNRLGMTAFGHTDHHGQLV